MNSTPDEAMQAETIEFKAEIRQLLDILVHSLYTEREIFLRELISNASDALSRLQFQMLTSREVLDPDAELCIRIETNKEERMLTITDTGIGMTKDDLTENLGTIARSGAREFIKAAQDTSGKEMLDVIGRFGVGFYSVFMVAEWVKVTSRAFQPDAEAASWYATGAETYQLGESNKADRGTQIEIKLREDAAEFADEYRLREIIKKHSDYVPFPIYLGDSDEKINQQRALWRQQPREIDETQYTDYYKQLTLEVEKPLEHIHIAVDAPVQIYALLYFPGTAQRGVFSLRREDGLKLYSHNVLIQEYTRELLPEYLRFIQGVVDSEDLPLNVSRESVQSNTIMARIKKVLTGKVLSSLKEMQLKDKESYERFWKEFGGFVKEGIASSYIDSERETLYPLLLFHTTRFTEEWTTLAHYVGRMKAGQREIFYILGEDQHSVMYSPHLDYFRTHGYEVITLTDPIDSFMLMGLTTYEGFQLKNVASADLDLPEDDNDSDEEQIETQQDAQIEKMLMQFKVVLGDKVTDVRATQRLSGSIARLVDPEGSIGQEMQRVYRLMGQEYEVPKKVLEVNPRHPIFVNLMKRDDGDPLQKIIIEQVYESALLVEGMHPDPASMIQRIQEIMEAALEN